MSTPVRELLTVALLDAEYFAEAEGRSIDERAELQKLPKGFEIERTSVPGRTGPRGFELRLFDCRFTPRRPVGDASRRFVGRPLVTWVDLKAAAAFAVVLRLAAVE